MGKNNGKGWVKLWRKTQDSNMYQCLNSKQRDVMINILMLANHKKQTWEWRGELQTCKPGQFKTSLSSLKDVCANDVSIQNIRTAIKKLKKWDFITNKSTKSGRVITVVHWEDYQDNGGSTNKDSNNEVTNNQQRGNKEVTTNKNEKNVENVENIKNIYTHWCEKSETISHRKLTDPMKKAIKARLKDFSVDEIKKGIDNYNMVIASDDYFFTYDNWALNEFLSREEGKHVEKFLENPEGFKRNRDTGGRSDDNSGERLSQWTDADRKVAEKRKEWMDNEK